MRITAWVLGCLCVFQAMSFGITLEAIYTGASGGNWNTASNWDINVVPINQGAVLFNVTIPAGKAVVFNVAGNSNINNFTLGDSGTNDAQLTLNAGCNLTVLGTANIYDFVNGNGGNFTATATSDSLKGTRNRIWAKNGSHVTIKDTTLDSSGLNDGSYTILSADGSGSILDLSGMTTLTDGIAMNGYYADTIQATNGGAINLSGLTSITGPNDDEVLNITCTGGSINLNSLATITHAGSYGFTKFNVTGNNLSLPALSSASFVMFTVVNSTVTLPALTSVSNGTFAVSSGGKIEAKSSSFTYSASGLNNGNYTILSADGSGSILDLSGMTTLTDGIAMNGYYADTIQATNGGAINLSGLTSITGPNDDEVLNITLNSTGGSINLNSLATITHAGSYGFTKFNVTGNNLSLPALSSASFVMFTVVNSTVTLPALTSVSNGTFAVSSGGKIEAKSSSFTYSASGLNNGNYTILSADGSGSILDLSGMTTLTDGIAMNGYYADTIQATNGGAINLSGLTSITGPNDDEVLNITCTGGSINLNSLATITHAGSYGFTKFNVTGNNLSLPALSSASFVMFTVVNSTVTLPALTSVSNGTFAVSSGGKIEAKSSSFTYSASGLNNGSYTILSADGSGSILDLSGMTTLTDGIAMNGYYADTIQATNGGAINLSGLTSITGPNDDETLRVNIDNAAIDMSSLTAINGTTGTVRFDVNNASSIELSSLTTVNGTTGFVRFTLDHQSEILAGNLTANAITSITLTNDSFFEVLGDLTFTKNGNTISLNGGSCLKVNNLSATGTVTVSTANAADYIEILGNLDLSNKITLNAAIGTIAVGGNYTYSWTDETKVKKTTMHFDGTGVQKLEVGGLDVDVYIGMLTNDNFSFGQLIVGQCDQPTLVQLVEEVDNGNRASSNPEALYLFGTPADPNCGLRILGGSTLMIGDLNVYAVINGTWTRLRDLFPPGQTLVHYTECDSDGYIMLGNPEINNTFNLVANGGFETGVTPPDATTLSRTQAAASGDLANWTISGDGIDWCHDALFNDASTTGALSIDLSGTPAGAGVVSQTFTTTPGKRYFVWFNLGFNPLGNPAGLAGDKKVEVRAAGQTQQFTINSTIASGLWPTDPTKGWTITWQAKTWSFVANDVTSTIEFACVDNPATAYGAAIDNVVVIEGSKVLSLLGGDMDHDYVVTLADLRMFVAYWLSQDCDSMTNCWCGGADIDRDGDVDMEDFALLSGNWLKAAFGTTYSITASSTAGGTITLPGIGVFNYSEVTIIPIAAEADAHYHFTGWTGTAFDAGKIDTPASPAANLTVDNSYTLQANFAIDKQTLTISSGPNGTVTLPVPGTYEYDYGTVVNVNAAANDHYHFAAWTGTAVEAGKVASVTSAATTVTMDGNYTLIATFTSDQYTLTTSTGNGGSITNPGIGAFVYDYETPAPVTAQPAQCYTFAGWTGTAVTAGKVTDPASASTTVLMDGNYTLQANFTLLTYTLTISAGAGGNVVVPGTGQFTYNCDQGVTITAQPAAHYHFTGWSGSAVTAGKVANPNAASTTVTIDANYTLQANFALDQYTLTITSGPNGTVTLPGLGGHTYNYGTVVNVNAAASDFYHFAAWTGTAVTAGKVANPNAAFTTVTVDADYTLQAEFAQNQIEAVVVNTLDTNPGWSASGQWAFGVPAGLGGTLFGDPDPISGYTGSNVYGVNLNGDYSMAVGGPYYMAAGPFNLTGYYETQLQFASWLNSDNADYVVHSLQISTNGSNWTTVWQQTGRDEIASSDWSIASYDISSLADNAGAVYVRWGYQILRDRTYPYSGWNIDDITFNGREK